ncbi:tyrosine-type recombinase/integrase [Armatimonas rosea]|uniref:Integrase/recombinase XerD n=1 Tax=Armatimonas rosea TaxID=685828 RepID=A0A7W9SPZ5_ARMRO|nr:tyrosine-type recombinase/integrase [Armatimonas rosea]MBB6050722.1 integrase/recombinase XerD [Armatimonas rosea]
MYKALGQNSLITWEEAIQEFSYHLQATRSPQTLRFYKVQLRQFTPWANENQVPFQGFGKRHLDRYLAYRQGKGIGPTTLRHDAICLKALCKWCSRNDLLERNPLADYEIRKAPAPARYMPPDDDVRAILEATRNYFDPTKNPDARFLPPGKRLFHRDRNIAITIGLLDSACRVGELLALKVEDYRIKERMIYIRESKGREPRALPVSPGWASAMEIWLRLRKKLMSNLPPEEDEGWLFINEMGNQADIHSFRRALKTYARWANLPGSITLHSLRRFSLNKLAKTNLLAAQTIAGHKETKTTLLYTKLDPDFVRDVHQSVGVVQKILQNPAKELVVRRKRLV